tara:strand:- start:286 stop:528 length:243 start_codon:yes stop_codon:yes gene_type:complete
MGEYSTEEVSFHNNENDGWIIINDNVYDITDFLGEHPGGKMILMSVLGTDATEFFEELHNSKILMEYGEIYKIGIIESDV